MILEVQNLSFSYHKGRTIFSDVNFSLDHGEILTILGPNGAGKSTLLNCITNLLSPTAGKVLLEGQDIRQLPLKEIAKVIGYVP